MTPLRIAITADLHYGPRHSTGRQATHDLVAHLKEQSPDVTILAGDIGAGDDFAKCLELFEGVPGAKCCVPGNHDVWVNDGDERGDSLRVYREYLPRVCRERGFHYLDDSPLSLPDSGPTIIGNMNWYDYSWGIDALRELTDDWEERLQLKRFLRGRHNDANFVKWPFDDAGFAKDCVSTFEKHLAATTGPVFAVTHHPPFRWLNLPRKGPPTLDGTLWECFSGNSAMEALLLKHSNRVKFAFCGHTHKERDGEQNDIEGFNIGGDYHFKRLLWLDWPTGTVTGLEFHGAGS